MKKKIILLLFFALVWVTVQAQTSKDSIYVYGIVADGFTKAAVNDAFVTLMREEGDFWYRMSGDRN